MALSYLMRNLSSSVYRGSFLGGLNKGPVKPSCSIFILQQPYHHQLLSRENSSQEFTSKCTSRQFATSAALLARHKGHDHGKLWTFERLLSAILLPLVPAALAYPSQGLDTALSTVIVLHTHFGLEAIVVDYVRPILFGAILPKVAIGLLYVFSIVTLAGLLNLIYNDAGLANTIINIWKI